MITAIYNHSNIIRIKTHLVFVQSLTFSSPARANSLPTAYPFLDRQTSLSTR